MGRFYDDVRMYWRHIVATLSFGLAVWKYVSLAEWEEYLVPMALAIFGFLCVVASHEVADWSGRYSWTYESF